MLGALSHLIVYRKAYIQIISFIVYQVSIRNTFV